MSHCKIGSFALYWKKDRGTVCWFHPRFVNMVIADLENRRLCFEHVWKTSFFDLHHALYFASMNAWRSWNTGKSHSGLSVNHTYNGPFCSAVSLSLVLCCLFPALGRGNRPNVIQTGFPTVLRLAAWNLIFCLIDWRLIVSGHPFHKTIWY